jgi:hypothetical protein
MKAFLKLIGVLFGLLLLIFSFTTLSPQYDTMAAEEYGILPHMSAVVIASSTQYADWKQVARGKVETSAFRDSLRSLYNSKENIDLFYSYNKVVVMGQYEQLSMKDKLIFKRHLRQALELYTPTKELTTFYKSFWLKQSYWETRNMAAYNQAEKQFLDKSPVSVRHAMLTHGWWLRRKKEGTDKYWFSNLKDFYNLLP